MFVKLFIHDTSSVPSHVPIFSPLKDVKSVLLADDKLDVVEPNAMSCKHPTNGCRKRFAVRWAIVVAESRSSESCGKPPAIRRIKEFY